MKRMRHPLSILAIAALPFVLYSVWRTGYEVAQLFDTRLLGTRYLWPILLLSSAVGLCCFFYRKTERTVFSFYTGVAVVGFLAAQVLEEYPGDYKLWIYIVAPSFTWSFIACAAALLFYKLHGQRA
jgi:hypothetical protein